MARKLEAHALDGDGAVAAGHDGDDPIAGNLTLRTGSTLDNDPARFTVGSCTKESGITILGGDPCP